jgi:NADH dehydrogenase [ubiquinone] 1 alpha subcomplex assembly factor 7
MISRVSEYIQANGPMTFDVFMEMCLYDPDSGFFSAGAVRPGERGDFVTSPEISPAFGVLLGRWAAMGLPATHDPGWAVVEVGAGSGSLIRQLVNGLDAGTAAYAVERSDAARLEIAKAVPSVQVVPDIDHIAAQHIVVVLNEVLDNIPASLVRRVGDGWDEIVIGLDGEELHLVDQPARPDVRLWATEHLGSMPDGSIATVQLTANALMESILNRFDGVSMCVIDYGGTTKELSSRTSLNVVRTYRHQRTGFDYLLHPGETDITVDVNIDALSVLGRQHGARVRSMSQSEFLKELGALELIDDLRSVEQQHASDGDVMGQLKARSEALGISALIDPNGFGSFNVVTFDREPRGRPPAS